MAGISYAKTVIFALALDLRTTWAKLCDTKSCHE
jgi:hypothetical protein